MLYQHQQQLKLLLLSSSSSFRYPFRNRSSVHLYTSSPATHSHTLTPQPSLFLTSPHSLPPHTSLHTFYLYLSFFSTFPVSTYSLPITFYVVISSFSSNTPHLHIHLSLLHSHTCHSPSQLQSPSLASFRASYTNTTTHHRTIPAPRHSSPPSLSPQNVTIVRIIKSQSG